MSFQQNFIKMIFLLLLFVFGFSLNINAQQNPTLRFNKEGKFKIVQFTDVHLKIENKPRCDSVMNTISMIIEKEKPDLVVLTGDIVTSRPVEDAWSIMTKPMRDAGIPWAAVFGNHDGEHGYSNKQIMKYLQSLPFNVSKHGPKNISGSGNYILEILNSKSKRIESLLYCFDSNAYAGKKDDEELGHYDWIKFDQVYWYRDQSIKYTKKNNGKPFPALAFFHIPLPEYITVQQKENTIGDKEEKVSSPKINSGMYNAFLESKDVMGMFVGHDHNNNYIGTLNNIALAYGCKTGKDSYGKLDKGGRVIVLYEGERKFDTWIHNTNEAIKYFVTYPDTFQK